MIGFQVDASQAYAAIDRKIFGIQKAVQGSAVTAGNLIAGELRARLVQPKRVNVQDSEASRVGRNAVRMSVDNEGVTVTLAPHWAVARSKVIFAIYSREGLQKELLREGLWVNTNRRSKQSGGYSTRAGLRFVSFSQAPKLLAWAERQDRGAQLFRHAVWLSVGARKVMEMEPAVAKFVPKLMADAVAGVRSA